MSIQRTCKACEKILVGRKDKKYCDHHCRSNFHNRNSDRNDYLVKTTNTILIQNRKILNKYVLNGHSVVQKDQLLNDGFEFGYITKIQKNDRGNDIKFCYEYGFQERFENYIWLHPFPESNPNL